MKVVPSIGNGAVVQHNWAEQRIGPRESSIPPVQVGANGQSNELPATTACRENGVHEPSSHSQGRNFQRLNQHFDANAGPESTVASEL